MKKWVIIGIIIRLLIIPITYHSDTRFFVFTNYLLVNQHLWLSFYDFLTNASSTWKQVFPPQSLTYPPLAILSGGLFAQLTYWLINPDFIRNFLLNTNDHLFQPTSILLIVLTKCPYIIIDLLAGYFLSQLVVSRQQLKVFKLWIVNPITLYATFAIGEFDIYPTFFTILAVWLISKHRPAISALSLGIGGAFKLFPLLFLPFLIFNYGRGLKEKSLILFSGLAGYLIPLLPYLPSSGFRTYSLLAPQSEKMLFAKIPVSGAEYLSIFITGYILIILFSHFNKLNLWKSVTAILLLFFAITHFHPQWFIWLSPWLILLYLKQPQLKYLIISLLCLYLFIIMSFESSLNWGILIWNRHAPDLITLLPNFIQLEKFKYLSLIRSIFAGLSIYLIYSLIRKLSTNKSTT